MNENVVRSVSWRCLPPRRRQLTDRMTGAIDRQRHACEAIDLAAKRLEATAETSFEMSASIEEAILALRERAYSATDGTLQLDGRETFVLTTAAKG